jgi:hypothetical protein
MEKIKEELLNDALHNAKTHYNTSEIYPVGDKETWNECFTYEDDLIILWYDIKIDTGFTTGLVFKKIADLK